MKDEDLREATASDPLTIEEEHAMQQSWRTDHDKLTFIVCLPIDQSSVVKSVAASVGDADERMIGDVNVFFYLLEDDEDTKNGLNGSLSTDGNHSDASQSVVGELELMIAETTQQGRGYGRATLLAMMYYVLWNWPSIAEEFGRGGYGCRASRIGVLPG